MVSKNPHSATQQGTSRLGWWALMPFALFLLALGCVTFAELPIRVTGAWVPSLGVEATLQLDGLALEMVLLITGIGGFVCWYAAGYSAADPARGRMFLFLLVFMAAMLGCVCVDNLLVLFACWELTSVMSFLLIGLDHQAEASRRAAQQALFVTGAGGLMLLAGVILLGQAAGTYSIQEQLATVSVWREHPAVPGAVACIIVAAFTKSAQFPFQFWLPNAMVASTPVSAYLHSATLVKLGVYVLARLDAAFDDVPAWEFTLMTSGGVSSVWAMLQALRERDVKRILAWSTIAALGTMVTLIGLPGVDSAKAIAALILAHALYKAPLFFVIGNVDHATGTRDIDQVPALARSLPWTAAAAVLAAASMGGIPLSFGHLAKDLTVIAKRDGQLIAAVGYANVMVSAFTIAVAAIAALRVFFRTGRTLPSEPYHEGGWAFRLPPLLIAGVAATLGVAPRLADRLIGVAAEAMYPYYNFSRASVVAEQEAGAAGLLLALGLGTGVFFAWDFLRRISEAMRLPFSLRIVDAYERGLRAVPRIAGATTRTLQRRSLPDYTLRLLAFVILGLSAALYLLGQRGLTVVAGSAAELLTLPSTGAHVAVLFAVLVLLVATVGVCTLRDSFLLLLVSGLAGMACAIMFLFLGAPDLALTQFVVEVAFVVVIASTLLRVRRLDLVAPEPQARWPRLLFAVAMGGLVAVLLVVAVGSDTFDPSLTQFFAEQSVLAAHGHNVVNVILVDFRAFDTLGEIVVVFVGFLAMLPLLARLKAYRGVTR